jgi:DNA-binding LacI/PurR family transcriptional regulator
MNLADVAKKAGVSVTTVSRVLNRAEYVKSSTRSKVLRVMKNLRYYPNVHARSLAGGSSRTIGVILSNLDNPFFLDIFRTIESLARIRGYKVVVEATHYDSQLLRECIRSMMGMRVAGIAAIVSEMEPSIAEELSSIGTPVVLYDVSVVGKNVAIIKLNYKKAMQQLVEYLYSLGHRRMAFIAYPALLQPTEDRRNAFLETMSRHSAPAHIVTPSSDGFFGGRDAARELLRSGFGPTAILCVNDITAVGVLRELRDQGISIPEQMSVTGFDNISLAQFTSPPLTTINIPRDEIGKLAFKALVSARESGSMEGQEIVLDPELIVRQSTGPCSPLDVDH